MEFAPSRQMCARVAKIVTRVKAENAEKAEKGEKANAPPWVPADVQNIVHEEDSWSGVQIDESVIDAALYYTLPVIKYDTGVWIRVFWASEERWATARVERVCKIQGTQPHVEIYFPDEGMDGSVTGADGLFAYELCL
jgi:hypothetical protein